MPNRRRAPALAHLLAVFMGMGLDAELAKDYWTGQVEPWNARHDVRHRFVKLAYLYLISSAVQIGIPMFILALAFDLYRAAPGAAFQLSGFSLAVAAGITLFSMIFGLLISLFQWRKINQERAETLK